MKENSMAESKCATLERFEETGQGCESNLFKLRPEFLPYPADQDHVVVGSGACRACKSEGRNPKTGGKPCGGYIRVGFSPDCHTCGHGSDPHVCGPRSP